MPSSSSDPALAVAAAMAPPSNPAPAATVPAPAPAAATPPAEQPAAAGAPAAAAAAAAATAAPAAQPRRSDSSKSGKSGSGRESGPARAQNSGSATGTNSNSSSRGPQAGRRGGSSASAQRSKAPTEPAEQAGQPRGGRNSPAGPSGQELRASDSLPTGTPWEQREPPLPASRSFDARFDQRGPFQRGLDSRRSGPALRGGTFSPPMQPTQQQQQQLNALYYQSFMYQQQQAAAAYGFLPGYMSSPTDALLAAVAQQIEYYFSVQNLCKDLFLRGRMDDGGWIPIEVIAGFNRVRALTTDLATIVQSLRGSNVVETAPDGRALRPRGSHQTWVLPVEQRNTPRAPSSDAGSGPQQHAPHSNAGVLASPRGPRRPSTLTMPGVPCCASVR